MAWELDQRFDGQTGLAQAISTAKIRKVDHEERVFNHASGSAEQLQSGVRGAAWLCGK